MLVFTRAKDDEVVVGDSITVRVVAVSGHAVRLGFDAPEHVLVCREAVYRDMLKKGAPLASLGVDKEKVDGMLVLTVELDEAVVLVDVRPPADPAGPAPLFAKVRLTDLRGAHARLGFAADRSIPVHRGEVYAQQLKPA